MRATILPVLMLLSSCRDQQGAENSSNTLAASGEGVTPSVSANILAVRRLVLSLPEFQARPTIFPRDEIREWRGIEGFTNRSIFGVMDIVGCGNGRDRIEPVEADVMNFTGKLVSEDDPDSTSKQSAFGVLDGLGFFDIRSRTITSRFSPQIFHCHVFNDRLTQWMNEHTDLLDTTKEQPGLVFAERVNPTFEFENEYRTELPLKGQVPMVSVRFTYEMRPTMPGLTPTGRGSGAAKAFLDSDTGRWTFLEFQLQDSNIMHSSPPDREERS
jgi:hypothetical protein